MTETCEDRDSNERGFNWRPGRGQAPAPVGDCMRRRRWGRRRNRPSTAENAPGMLPVSDDVWLMKSLRRVPMARSARDGRRRRARGGDEELVASSDAGAEVEALASCSSFVDDWDAGAERVPASDVHASRSQTHPPTPQVGDSFCRIH